MASTDVAPVNVAPLPQDLPLSDEEEDLCCICYSAPPDTLTCKNAHFLCGECYHTMMTGDRSANKNCAECRAPMFRWGTDPTLDPDPVVARERESQALRARAMERLRLAEERATAERARRREVARIQRNARRRAQRAQQRIAQAGAMPANPAVNQIGAIPTRPVRCCGICGTPGHDRRTCPRR